MTTFQVLHRARKDGIGPAYVAGFRQALDAGAELIAQMDADFSHDPADLPRLIAAAGEADLALGSRYVEGGGVAQWGPTRRLISRGGSAYARAILGVGVKRPDRRLQGLPARGARAHRPGDDRVDRLRVSGRDHLPRRSGPAFASSRCRSSFATAASASRR